MFFLKSKKKWVQFLVTWLLSEVGDLAFTRSLSCRNYSVMEKQKLPFSPSSYNDPNQKKRTDSLYVSPHAKLSNLQQRKEDLSIQYKEDEAVTVKYYSNKKILGSSFAFVP